MNYNINDNNFFNRSIKGYQDFMEIFRDQLPFIRSLVNVQ